MLSYNINDISALQRKYMAMTNNASGSTLDTVYTPGVHVEKITGSDIKARVDRFVRNLNAAYADVSVTHQRTDTRRNVAFVTFRIGA